MKCSLYWCPAALNSELPFCNRHWKALPRMLQRRIIAKTTPGRVLSASCAALAIKAGLLPTQRGYTALKYFGFRESQFKRGLVALK